MAYEVLKYVNHLNETLSIGEDNKVFVNENDLRDYAWSLVSSSNKISGFKKEITEKTMPLRIIGDDAEERNKILNELFELGEKDVLTAKSGKLWIGDYYLKCFITASTKKNYLKKSSRYVADEIKITTDYPWWTREITHSYIVGDMPLPDGQIVTTKRNLDFNFDFDVDFLSNEGARTLYNPSVVNSNFKMVIYGPVVDPIITINNHIYKLNLELVATEYVTIDSVAKTIIMHHYDTTDTNEFNNRDKENYIFQKIDAGYNTLIWDGTFRFDLTLYDERSEPVWI